MTRTGIIKTSAAGAMLLALLIVLWRMGWIGDIEIALLALLGLLLMVAVVVGRSDRWRDWIAADEESAEQEEHEAQCVHCSADLEADNPVRCRKCGKPR